MKKKQVYEILLHERSGKICQIHWEHKTWATVIQVLNEVLKADIDSGRIVSIKMIEKEVPR